MGRIVGGGVINDVQGYPDRRLLGCPRFCWLAPCLNMTMTWPLLSLGI